MDKSFPKIVFLSNGYGEDNIAFYIINSFPDYLRDNIFAFPLVSEGEVFKNNGIKVIGYVKPLPSKGISGFLNLRNFLVDIKSGLFSVLYNQLKFLKKLGDEFFFVAVGDIVPLLLLNFSGKIRKSFFIATAKSIRTEIFNPFEIFLMRKTIASFLRDKDSLDWVYRFYKIKNVYFFGNPVLDIPVFNDNPLYDFFNKSIDLSENYHNRFILVLPGRKEVCLKNLEDLKIPMLQIMNSFPDVVFIVVIPNFYPLSDIRDLFKDIDKVFFVDSKYYGSFLRRGYLVWGFGGSANEQAAGFGIPVISFNQKNWYRNRQKKLLKDSLILVSNKDELIEFTKKFLNNRDYRDRIGSLGKDLMGEVGGGSKIVNFIISYLKQLK